jgi:hypothetical protein
MNVPMIFNPLSTTLLVVEIAFAVCVVILIGASLARTRWGFNLSRVSCPACSEPQQGIRKVTSLRQKLWGGYTCPKCACEMDKWGRRLSQ